MKKPDRLVKRNAQQVRMTLTGDPELFFLGLQTLAVLLVPVLSAIAVLLVPVMSVLAVLLVPVMPVLAVLLVPVMPVLAVLLVPVMPVLAVLLVPVMSVLAVLLVPAVFGQGPLSDRRGCSKLGFPSLSGERRTMRPKATSGVKNNDNTTSVTTARGTQLFRIANNNSPKQAIEKQGIAERTWRKCKSCVGSDSDGIDTWSKE
jgi:hypothetical protein